MFFEKNVNFRAECGVTRFLLRFGSSGQLFQIFLSALVFISGISDSGGLFRVCIVGDNLLHVCTKIRHRFIGNNFITSKCSETAFR